MGFNEKLWADTRRNEEAIEETIGRFNSTPVEFSITRKVAVDGNVSQSATLSLTDFWSIVKQEVKSGEIFYVTTIITNSTQYGIKFVNSSGVIISTFLKGNGIQVTYTDYEVVVPEGAVFMYVNANTATFNIVLKKSIGNDSINDEFKNSIIRSRNTKNFVTFTAHRGAFNAPENTNRSIIMAKQQGYESVEVDVKKTSDGVFVLLHDLSINRTAKNLDGSAISGTVNIADITYAQSQNYDFGLYKSFEFRGEKIPKFEDVLILCKKLNLRVQIDTNAAYASDLVAMVRRCGMERNVAYLGYDLNNMNIYLALDSKASVGFVSSNQITAQNISDLSAIITPYNDVFIDVNSTYMLDAIIHTAMEAGLRVEAWTLTNSSQILSAVEYGLTGMNVSITGNVGDIILYQDGISNT